MPTLLALAFHQAITAWHDDAASAGGVHSITSGIAMGIGMALLEETVSDRTGRLATTSLAEYVVASAAVGT
jgi:Molybdopterin cofactor-binding domain